MPGVLVSMVIPVRGDPAPLARLLATVPPTVGVQLIVTASGSKDERWLNLERQRPDVAWTWGDPGRGHQMNRGARLATGRWLWFVHADSRIPVDFHRIFEELDTDPGAKWGAFRFGLDSASWQARLWERGVALRVRIFDRPYGDQGIFVRREVFQTVQGFREIPLMEDVDLVTRLKRLGPGRHQTEQLMTSAVRWEREGWLRRSLRNLWLLALYYGGVPPETLAGRYERQSVSPE